MGSTLWYRLLAGSLGNGDTGGGTPSAVNQIKVIRVKRKEFLKRFVLCKEKENIYGSSLVTR